MLFWPATSSPEKRIIQKKLRRKNGFRNLGSIWRISEILLKSLLLPRVEQI
jgi:hypothetical protein